jgi:hypothetical protein
MGTNSVCIGRCKHLERDTRFSQGMNIYEKNAYCRHCKVYFLKDKYLKKEGRPRCPCCRGQVRMGASASAKNKTRRRRLQFPNSRKIYM